MDPTKDRSQSVNEVTRRRFMWDSALGAAGVAAGLTAYAAQDKATQEAIRKTRSYNPDMEYRQMGNTGVWASAVCLGGHWKRIDKMIPGIFKGRGWLSADIDDPDFRKNRHDVVSRCIEHGINYIDACTYKEIQTYSRALEGRRESMYLGFSWYEQEARREDRRTADRLIQTLDEAMNVCKQDYVDLWRITCLANPRQVENGNKLPAHTMAESEEIAKALDKAKQDGKARFTGVSSHDRDWLALMIKEFPDQMDAVVTPYTAKSKKLPEDSIFDAALKHDCGIFGIKPFAGNSLFKGNSAPGNPHAEEDDKLARLAVRYILGNPALTAPIPGMINTHQVDNMAKAVKERWDLDLAEARELEEAMETAWNNLPDDYQWLKNWEYV